MGWLPFRRLRTGSTGSTRRSARRAHSASHCWRPGGRSPSAVARTATGRSPPERRAALIVRKGRPVGALLASGGASVRATRQLEPGRGTAPKTGGVLLTREERELIDLSCADDGEPAVHAIVLLTWDGAGQEVMPVGGPQRLHEVPGGVVGGADVADLVKDVSVRPASARSRSSWNCRSWAAGCGCWWRWWCQ